MIFKVNQRCLLALCYVAATCLKNACCQAESTIDTDMTTLEENGKMRFVAVSVSIDNKDLFNMEKIFFSGMENGNDSTTYTKTTATMRSSSDSGGNDEIVWNGVIADPGRIGFATLVQSSRGSSGNIIGTMTTETTSYHLVSMHDGQTQLRAMDWVDAKAIEADYDEDQDDITTRLSNPDNIELSAVGYYSNDHSGTLTYSVGNSTSSIIKGPGNNRLLRTTQRNLQTGPTIDILVLITNRAMCEYAGLSYPCELNDGNKAPIEAVIPMLESQTNEAISNVEGEAQVRIVEAIHLDSEFDGRPTSSTLDVISTSSSVQQWRNEYGADLVAMLTGDNPTTNRGIVFGIAGVGSFESATSIGGIQFYTFPHEIGHNLGALHDRNNCNLNHPYAHGLQVPGVLRTIMSYQCDTSSCPLLPVFSADGFTYDGTPIGDSSHDNARIVRENAPTVARYRSSANPPPVNPPTNGGGGSIGGGSGGGGGSSSGGGFCFSRENMVEIRGKGLVTLDNVKIGDYVKDSSYSYSRVYSYSHIDSLIDATFVQLWSEGIKQPLELSHDHMVYISSGKVSKAVRGKDVKISDELVGPDGIMHKVTSIQLVKRKGVFAPLTESGDIVVSGLMASSYVALLHYSTSVQNYATHAVLSPLRLVCNMNFNICENEKYTDGLSNLILQIIYLVRHVAEYNVYVQLLLTAGATPLFLAAYFVEQTFIIITGIHLSLVVIAVSSWFYMFHKTMKNKVKNKKFHIGF